MHHAGGSKPFSGRRGGGPEGRRGGVSQWGSPVTVVTTTSIYHVFRTQFTDDIDDNVLLCNR